MQNVLLLGATGFVGSALLSELLSRGHQVTALVRDPAKLPQHERLTAVQGDVTDVDALVQAMQSKDAVISAYNPGWTNPNIKRDTEENYPKILRAAKLAGAPRLLIVGGAGSLFVAPGVRVMDTGALPEEIMDGVRSLAAFYLDHLMAEKELDWVFFSPAGMLEPGERTGVFRLGKDELIVDAEGNSRISVEDYALAMVDELEKPQHHRERFTIGY